MSVSTKLTFAIFVVFTLAGCNAMNTTPNLIATYPSLANKIPVSSNGTTRVKDVIIEPISETAYQLLARSTTKNPKDILMAVLWCRAQKLAAQKGYSGWRPLALKTVLGRNRTVAFATIRLLKKKTGVQKNWCAVVRT